MALTNKGNIIINGIEFKPKSMKPNYESLATEDSGRTDDGVMRIYWVLDRIRKWEIVMPPMTSEQQSRLLSLVQGREYYMTYWDTLANQEITRKFYTSNSSADMYSGYTKNGLWLECSFNAIELGGEINGAVREGQAETMDNKLVFEPTTLTQYNWNKYQLIENRTYKWDKYEAVPEYLYTYYWNKYEAVPPGLTNRWDVCKASYEWPYEYDENLILQNIYYNSNVQAGNHQGNFLRVLRNNNVISDNGYEVSSYISVGGSGTPKAKTTIKSQAKGAYLFLTPAVLSSSNDALSTTSGTSISLYNYRILEPNYSSYPSAWKDKMRNRYLAKTLKDITQMTDLVSVNDIYYDNQGNKRTIEEASSILLNYWNEGYQYYFRSIPTVYPSGDLYNANTSNINYDYIYQGYENGFILGSSIKVYDELHNQYGGDYYPPSGVFRGLHYGATTTNNPTFTGINCQFNDCLWPQPVYTYYGNTVPLSICRNGHGISYIGLLRDCNSTLTQYEYDAAIINCDDYANLCITHKLTYNHYVYDGIGSFTATYKSATVDNYYSNRNDLGEPTNIWFDKYFAKYIRYSSGIYTSYDDTTASSSTFKFVRRGNRSMSRPGTFITSIYNAIDNFYSMKFKGGGNEGFTDGEWIVYYGKVPVDKYTPGDFIETVESNIQTAYPEDDEQNGYYYIYQRYIREVIEWHIGVFIEKATLISPTYPINGVYPDDYEDTTHYWYSYLGYDSRFFKGDFVSAVSSYIEAAYPQNSYIISDGWYVYTGSADIIVGQLIIDNSLLMGGVNYTQEINPSEDLQIGTPGAAQIDFTIFAPDASAATQYLGKDFTYYVKMNSDADWRQIGTFTLTKAELPDKQTAKIQGFDYIYKFDTIIDEWLDEQTFPMTLGDMFASLCEYVGCEAYSTDFTNSDFMVNDNFEAVQITGRTILQYITEASGGFCVAEPDGRIHLKHYAIPPTGAVNLGNNSYRKYTHEIYNVPVISSVVVRKDDDDEGVESNV